MKKRILKIVPFVGTIIAIIYLTSCHQTYDSNNIPSSSTSNKTSDELYNGTGDKNAEPVMDRKDTGHTVEMTPPSSTSASTLTTPSQKK